MQNYANIRIIKELAHKIYLFCETTYFWSYNFFNKYLTKL